MDDAGFWRKRGNDCSSYEPGLYTWQEISQMIFVHGYIPVYDAAEFLKIFTGASETMGAGTCWEGEYKTGGNKKYVQVGNIDFAELPQGTNSYDSSEGFVFDGNEISITNFSSNRSGLIRINNGTIKNVILFGDVTDSDSASGAGLLCSTNNGTITNCQCNGNVTRTIGTVNVATGGFCGISKGEITTSSYVGNVTSNHQYVGGFVGQNNGGTIELCSANGNVTQDRSGGNCFLGGFVGSNNNSGIIKECYYVGDVSNINADPTRRQMGGFVGSNRAASQIVNCYAWGTINGGSFVGGFCGNTVTGATIQNSYCAVAVTASGATIGGFQSTGGGVVDCYYDSDVSLVSGGDGTPKTTSELQTPTSNTGIYANWSPIAWDFGTSSEYPKLINTP